MAVWLDPNTLVIVAWVVWYVTWMAAVVFSGRTKVQMKTDMLGMHRIFASLGFYLLFIPGKYAERFLGVGAGLFRGLVTPSTWIAWGLFGATIGGFGFCWWARLHLGRLWSGLVTLKDGHHIVDTGPYGLVRHPIYSGVMVSAVMTALMKSSPAALIGAAMIIVGFALTARIEERFLRAQLGAGAYDDYSRRVGMLVPGLGKAKPS